MSDSTSPKPVSVLFVCLGNICQYPSPALSNCLALRALSTAAV